jgi:hypothetical protein
VKVFTFHSVVINQSDGPDLKFRLAIRIPDVYMHGRVFVAEKEEPNPKKSEEFRHADMKNENTP